MSNYTNITPEELEIFLQAESIKVPACLKNRSSSYFVVLETDNKPTLPLFLKHLLLNKCYGSVAPRTPMGQIFCVFYVFLGIPLTITFLKFMSNAISQPFSRLREHLQNMGIKERKIKIYTLIFFLITGLVIFILPPSLLFMHTGGWTYKKGLYFAFISLSTIGFGDYVLEINKLILTFIWKFRTFRIAKKILKKDSLRTHTSWIKKLQHYSNKSNMVLTEGWI